MNSITEFLNNDDAKLGLFESPTGTGKSLSLLCSLLTHRLGGKPQSDDGDWLSKFGQTHLEPIKNEKRTYSQISGADIKQIQLNLKRKRDERRMEERENNEHCLINYESDEESKKQKKLKDFSVYTQNLKNGKQA